MPNGNTVASAYVQIVPSAEGIKGSITQALGGEASSAGESLGSTLVGKIKGVIAAAGIGAALGKTLTEGAALQQSIGGVETLFKDSADTIKQYAQHAYSTAGVSANSYMEQVTSFSATLLQGLGGDTAAAAKYANQAIVQMSDNANKMGTDIGSIQWAYQGFAKDNYTMLDNLKLGYGGTQAEMARLINDSGVLGDAVEVTAQTVKDVPFDKIIEAIGVIQDDLGITGTTAQEAATTFSGSFASMQAAASNVMGSLMLGQDLKPALQGLADTVTTFLFGNFFPAIGNILQGLPSAIGTFISSAGPQISSAIGQALGNISPDLSELWNTLSAKIGEIWISLGNLAGPVSRVFESVTPLLKSALILANEAAVQLANAFNALGPAAESVAPVLQGMFDSINTFVQGNATELVQAFAAIATGFGIFKTLTGIVSILSPIVSVITGIVSAITSASSAGAALASVVAVLGGPVTIVVAAISALAAGFIYLWNTCEPFKQFWIDLGTNIANFVSGAAQGIVNFFTVTLPNGLNSALLWFQQLPSNIAAFFTQTLTNVGAWVANMVAKASEMGSQFLQNVVTFFTQLPYNVGYLLGSVLGSAASWVVNMVAKAAEMGTQFLQNVVTFFTQLPSNISAFLTAAVANVTAWVSQMAQAAISVGTQFISNVVTFFSQLPGNIQNWLTTTLTNVTNWAVQLGQKGLEAAKNLVSNVVTGAKELPEKLVNIGKMAVEGLWKGITGAAGWLKDQIGSFVSGIVDGFTSSFDINSPSKVMADKVGRFLPPGIAEGMMNALPALSSAIAKISDTIQTGLIKGTAATQRLMAFDTTPAQRLRTTLATAAANPPQLNPVPSAPAGGAITYEQLLQLINLVIAAIRENGGEIVIGDDVIGRANARYMQDRAIVTGGAVF